MNFESAKVQYLCIVQMASGLTLCVSSLPSQGSTVEPGQCSMIDLNLNSEFAALCLFARDSVWLLMQVIGLDGVTTFKDNRVI